MHPMARDRFSSIPIKFIPPFSHKWKRNLKIHREAQKTPDKGNLEQNE